MTAYGLAILFVSGLLSVVFAGFDLGIDADIDTGDLGFDVGDEFGWETGSEAEMSDAENIGTDQEENATAEHPPLEQVDGYVRDDGTEVESYVRTQADGDPSNNLSS